jgi:hypothetical protein
MTEPAGQVRVAAAIVTLGSVCAIAGSFLPWIQATDPEVGITLSKVGVDGHYAMLADLLALVATGIAGIVLLRGQAPTPVPVALTAFALAQLGLVLFVGSNLSRGVAQLEAAGASAGLGIGLYLAALGAAIAVAGATLMWIQGRRLGPQQIP